jgi:hypothetical protein
MLLTGNSGLRPPDLAPNRSRRVLRRDGRPLVAAEVDVKALVDLALRVVRRRRLLIAFGPLELLQPTL